MATSITYSNKNTSDSLPASEFNQIKSVVNNNATELDSVHTTVDDNSAAWGYGESDLETYLNGNLNTHVIPLSNSTYDIGSAEKKIRHLYLSQNSLKFVDENETEFSLGVNQSGQLTLNSELVGSGGTSFSLSALDVAGDVKQSVTYTHMLYDATAGNITVDLLEASTHTGVTQHKRVDNSANTVTLSSSTGATIDGATEYILNTQYEAVGLYTDGTDYYIQ